MSKQQCFCGCDNFRYKHNNNNQTNISYAICRNCNHTLTEHIHLPSLEQ